VRQFADGEYAEGGRSQYIRHPVYAVAPSNYIRAFLLIQKDMQTLFEYLEPADQNLGSYSFRTFELLLRVCTEVEANFKAIFRANTYSYARHLDVTHYVKVNSSHFLSEYEAKMPYWDGGGAIRQPFKAWGSGTHELTWYKAYNQSKHDRAQNLKVATFENIVDAFTGLAVLLAAQFYYYDFGPMDDVLSTGGINDGFEEGIGGYVRIKYPSNVPAGERYDFDWQMLASQTDPFQKFNFNVI